MNLEKMMSRPDINFQAQKDSGGPDWREKIVSSCSKADFKTQPLTINVNKADFQKKYTAVIETQRGSFDEHNQSVHEGKAEMRVTAFTTRP